MMNYIGIGSQFLNLAAIVQIEDVLDDKGNSIALITTTAGAEIELEGDEAEALFKCIELIAMETDAARQKLRDFIATQTPTQKS